MDYMYVRGPGGMASILQLTEEIKRNPYDPDLYMERSQCYRVVQQYYHAVNDAKKVISLRPEWVQGYYLKGLAEHGAEHYQTALETFEEALDYSTSEDLIRALQKARRAWFVSRMDNSFRMVKGLFLGCLVGALALTVNSYLPKPVIENIFLKIGVMIIWGYFGMESGKNYSQAVEEDRKKRLEKPADLFPFTSTDETESDSKTGKPKMASACVGTSTDDGISGRQTSRSRRGKKQTKS